MNCMRTAVCLAIVAGLGTAPASADVIFDDFSSVGDPNQWPVVILTIDSVDVFESGLSNVIGGTRHSTVRSTFLEEPGLDFVQAAIVPNFGMILDYSSTAGARGDWELRYDANGAGLNADFTGITDIILDFGRFDFANGQPLPVLVTLSDGQNQASLTRSLTTSGAQSLFFALADFGGIGLLDASSLQSISVFLDPGVAVDFRLSRVFGVPSPGSLALLTLGTVVVAGRRRRTEVTR